MLCNHLLRSSSQNGFVESNATCVLYFEICCKPFLRNSSQLMLLTLPLTQPQLLVSHYGLCVCLKSALSFHTHDLIWAQTWPVTRLLSLVCKYTPLWVPSPLWSPGRCVSDAALVWHYSFQHSSLVPNPVFYTIQTSRDGQNLFESGLTQLIPNGLISFLVSSLLCAQSKSKSVIPDSFFLSKGMMCF